MAKAQAFRFCFCFKRMFKLSAAEPPEDVIELFNQNSENGTMSLNQFHRFLVDYQGEQGATLEDAQNIVNSFKHLNIFQRRGLSLDAFFRYLLGENNPPLPPPQVYQDMKAPLAHYYLYTGHNSYLTGNQLSSDSSVEPIIKALKRGVRVIELDLWPNPNKDGIDVRHGGTMTSSVDLRRCLLAIKDNAFVASEYPVIITFEDHLDSRLQAEAAEMVSEIFEGTLCRKLDSQEFPSPDSLKNRILISTKPPKESRKMAKEERRQNVRDPIGREPEDNQDEESDEDEDEDEERETQNYNQLIAIHAGKHKGSLRKTLNSDFEKAMRMSFSEPQLEDAIKDHATDVVNLYWTITKWFTQPFALALLFMMEASTAVTLHSLDLFEIFTRRNLLRVYPKGTRIGSSNYNPMNGWIHGAQMVAVNMQGYDKHLWITHGMFRANGGCGYVKKPDFLLKDGPNGEVFDPKDWRPVKKILKVKLYLGDGWHLDFSRTHFDPFSPPDFFTTVQIFGVPADITKGKTRPIEDEWTPVWDHEFEFPLTVPELALLKIQVREFDTDRRHAFGGQTCLPVWELKTGVRAVPLYDKKGEKFKSIKLLMRFQFENYD